MSVVKSTIRFVVLFVIFVMLFIFGSMAAAGAIPTNAQSEPGLLSDEIGLLVITLTNLLIIMTLLLTSRWKGWKLAVFTTLAYYGAVTVVMQVETWYFLSDLTVDPQFLPLLFLMGIPTTFIFIPLAVKILGKWGKDDDATPNSASEMPFSQWAWKIAVIAIAYLLLYWTAGYFIAWQNPELRAFYGHSNEIVPFLLHTKNTLHNDPTLFPFQIFRAMLWTLCALPIIRGSKVNAWRTALIVGLFFSVPQNISHLISNPLLPIASIRMSHMIETMSSSFIFGLIVVWLLHRKHNSFRDLFGISGMKARWTGPNEVEVGSLSK